MFEEGVNHVIGRTGTHARRPAPQRAAAYTLRREKVRTRDVKVYALLVLFSNVHTYTQVRTYARARSCVVSAAASSQPAFVQLCTRAYVLHLWLLIFVCVCGCVCVCTHAHTHTHTHTHTHAHTLYLHVAVCVRACLRV